MAPDFATIFWFSLYHYILDPTCPGFSTREDSIGSLGGDEDTVGRPILSIQPVLLTGGLPSTPAAATMWANTLDENVYWLNSPTVSSLPGYRIRTASSMSRS